MFWGSSKEDQTRASIAQPPPTPGLASWAFNSVFNRQTPSSKYANMMHKKDEINRAAHQSQDSYKRSDTPRQPMPGRFNDDTVLSMSSRRNVAWGGEDFKVRSRSSSFSERPVPKRFVDDNGSIHNKKDSDFYKDNELLRDDYSEYDTLTKKKNFDISPIKRSILPRSHRENESIKPIPQTSSYFNGKNSGKTSLPETYPGKYPSPYVARSSSFDSNDLLSSSAVRNFEKAKSNTRLNQLGREESKPQFKLPQYSPPKPRPSRPRDSYRERLSAMAAPKHGERLRFDEQMLLDSIDENIAELDNITNNVGHLKLQKNDQKELELKYLEMRQDLIQELKKSKKLYDSYYQFVNKYKELKKRYRESANDDSMAQIKKLQKEIYYLQTDNDLLTKKLNERDTKFLDNDSTISDLKKTLTNSSNFEVTLRRKIKYLEDKIDQQELNHKNEKFDLNQKNFMLEMKLKDEEDLYKFNLQAANERIRDLEKQLKQKTKSQEPRNISIIPEYTTSNNKRSTYADENDDTYELLHKKFADKKINSIKHSPDKRYSTGNIFTHRPSSNPLRPSHKQYNDVDQDLFKNFDRIDESTSNDDYFAKYQKPSGHLRSNSLRANSNRQFPSSKRYSNPNLSNLTFNTSELG